jgi:hypothetical protein
MAQLRDKDRTLFSTTELTLIRASQRPRLPSLNAARLRSLITRARRAADKYRHLLRGQRRAQKRRTGTGRDHAAWNTRTRRKLQLLGEAADRFDQRLKQIKHPMGQTRPARRSLQAAPDRTTQRETLRKEQQRRRALAEAAQVWRRTDKSQQGRVRTIRTHIQARGRRQQGRRDTRSS